MELQNTAGEAEPRHPVAHWHRVLLWLLVITVFPYSTGLLAQTDAKPVASEIVTTADIEPPAEPAEIVVTLPQTHQMTMDLVTPALRQNAFLDLAVVVNLLNFAEKNPEAENKQLVQKFLDDRAWLASLIERYGWVPPHAAVLDPAAWVLLSELGQHDLDVMPLVYPGQTQVSGLLHQVFQRSAERLAAANLPVLLFRLEADSGSSWDKFLTLTAPGGVTDTQWKAVETSWFADRSMPLDTELEGRIEELASSGESIASSVSQLVLSSVEARPPDSRRLMGLRYSIYTDIPGLSGTDRLEAMDFLHFSSLVDGLHDDRYFNFSRGLLSITLGLIRRSDGRAVQGEVIDLLIDELPSLSAHYSGKFAQVDPRLNNTLATVYTALQFLSNPAETVFDKEALLKSLADAVAQLTLLIPDMDYYLNTPVRARIAEEIDICTSIAANLDAESNPVMTRRQLDGCVENFLQLADREARMTELSGDINGPFENETLRRELNLASGQRINYGIGYLYQRYSTSCLPPTGSLPNPLEWAVLANGMVWLAEYAPEYFYTPENESRLERMRSIGEQLIRGLSAQAACFAGSGTRNADPIIRSMAEHELALRQLDAGMSAVEVDFRKQRLKPFADISLDKDASQYTAYRPDGLVIKPCDTVAVCEMSGELSTTRALIGLFPEQYLVADQSGMGQIEICYRNMEWIHRRSELVRPDDENVANYFGHLGFDLVGRYREGGDASDIFGFRFTSPAEHHYLFAQSSDEVLQDSCPVEWVGSRVITTLRSDRGGLVPNRLTYLAASRTLPSRLLSANWDRGAEWRDWFVTGIGVQVIQVQAVADISTRLNQHLQSMYQAEQAEIYQRVLLPTYRNSRGDENSLFEEMSRVSTSKSLIRMLLMLFYPESLFTSDQIRLSIAGDNGLLERRSLRYFRENNVPLTSVNRIARGRLNELQTAWLKQPQAVRSQGSIPVSLMYALTRINIIYWQLFSSPPEPLEEIEVKARTQGQG